MGEEQPINLIDKADAIAKRIEEANIKAEEFLRRQEEIMTRQLLGGRSEITKQEVKQPELTPQEYAQKALKGKI